MITGGVSMPERPLGYLDAWGERAQEVLPLTWFTLIVSIIVCVVIGVLLWMAVRRAVPGPRAEGERTLPVERGGAGLRWIGIGLLISAVPLFGTVVWTMVTLAAVAGPPADAQLTLEVTGHQWWWEVRYDSPTPSESFITANEIHIPVGPRVLVKLRGQDVIHSFWVPKLSGKTDVIPGQINQAWLQADTPGRYMGQCAEYCGDQHAHMQLTVVAEPPADFERWRQAQLRPAPAPAGEQQRRGMELVVYRCGACHRVLGTLAGAVAGPDLTHVATRQSLAAGVVPNNPGALAGWIENPQALKPGALMPNQNLPPAQLADVLAYLETLK
jgi:cytochrome c oxidase subunit II